MSAKMKSCSTLLALACMAICGGCGKGEGVTPLMKAAHSGDNEELTDLIFSEGVNLNETSRYGWTALMFASWRGHAESVKKLLLAGADPNIVSEPIPSSFETVSGLPSTTALREAIRSRHFEIAVMLLDGGAKIDGDAIAFAAKEGEIPLVARMLKLGGNVNENSHSAFYASPLCAASSAGKLEMVQWLIGHGADPNLEAIDQTPLEDAVSADQVEIVKYLLENGADPNLVFGSMNATALIEAVTKHTDDSKYEENLSIIKILLSHGANRNYKGGFADETALGTLRIQKENGLKYLKKSANPKMIKSHEARIRHREAIIALLEK